MPKLVTRILAGLVSAACAGSLFCVLYAGVDLRAFEFQPLFSLFGVAGLAYVTMMVAGAVVLGVATARAALYPMRPWRARARRVLMILLAVWGLSIAWLADWVLLESPLTVRVHDRLVSGAKRDHAARLALLRFSADGSLDALGKAWPDMNRQRAAIMMARIAVNRPSVFEDVAIGRAIAENAARYYVSPVLLLHWCYLDSFYGEAPAGPMPFFAEINAEMFRDLVQAHLPGWFVESRIRVALIERPIFNRLAPDSYAVKLRYAVQKATYDIAIAPYMNSVMSDLFLVLREYPDEFPELFGTGAAPDPLVQSFSTLRDEGLMHPYHDPYAHPRRTDEYYDRYRDELVSFGRAAVYRLIDDFEFATKAQALVARYYADQFRKRLGAERWDALTERQQTSLLAMLRDVYTPNIGRLSYNLYMVPEFNTTPINFLADEASRDFGRLSDPAATWIPSDRTRLWGATGLMLRTLSETWEVATGEGLAGLPPTSSTGGALAVLARQQ